MQVFRDIPMQVKVTGGGAEIRRGLGRRFDAAVKRAMPAARNPLMERRWVELGTRYGDAEEVAAHVVAEVRALYDSDRLAQLSDRALSSDQNEPEAKPDRQRLIGDLDDPDWRARYRALRRLGADARAAAQDHSARRRRSPVGCAGRRSCCWGCSRTRGLWPRSATRCATRSRRSVEPPGMRSTIWAIPRSPARSPRRWPTAALWFAGVRPGSSSSWATSARCRACRPPGTTRCSRCACRSSRRSSASRAGRGPRGPVWQRMTGSDPEP